MSAEGDISTGRPWPPGWTVRHVAQTASTNDDLVHAATDGAIGDRHVLVADHQTAGRGRLDRRWDAPAGTNLLASCHLVPSDADVTARSATQAMHRIGLAVLEAVEVLAADRAADHLLGLKWPNDVLCDGRKLAGVLAQRSSAMSGVVVGFGVNVGWAPQGAARVGELCDTAPLDLLAVVMERYDALPTDITETYRSRLLTLGQHVRLHLPGGGEVVGSAYDITPDGRLSIRDDEGVARTFDVGDVVHLRPRRPGG